MKLLMDADCLIKLVKAGLKELVCTNFTVSIPYIVRKEVVDAGKANNHPDALVVEQNINNGVISVIEDSARYKGGDEALIASFKREQFDAIATDDVKLLRSLKALRFPFILPGIIIVRLRRDGLLGQSSAHEALERLAEFISEDEYSTVRLLLGDLR